MYEKSIHKAIVEQLNTTFEKKVWVRDFPININDYSPTNNDGEILVQSLGYRIARYADANNKLNILSPGSFAIYESQWQLLLIIKNIISLDKLYELTGKIITSVMSITQIEDLDTIFEEEEEETTNYIDNLGRFRDTDISMPTYDEEREFQYRQINFIIPVILFTGEA